MNKVTKYLNGQISGSVFDDSRILENYATDQSILKVTPRFVALPKSLEDIQSLVKFSNSLVEKGFDLPITVRGSGLSRTGASLGSGMVISMEKMNKIQEIDERSSMICVQAGTTLGQINDLLSSHSLTIPILADPKSTIGGLISSYIVDPQSKKYGGIFHYVERLEVVLSNGEVLQTTSFTPRGLKKAKIGTSFSASLYQKIHHLHDTHFDAIEDIKNSPRSFSGYHMISEVSRKKTFDLAPLFFAAEGTLGIISEVILHCESISRTPIEALVGFSSVRSLLDFVEEAKNLSPTAINLYDTKIFANDFGKNLQKFNLSSYKFVVLMRFEESPWKMKFKMKKLAKFSKNKIIVQTSENSLDFANFHSVIENYLNSQIEGFRPFILDDFSVPNKNLATFLEDLRQIEQVIEKDLFIMGSILTNSYSIRPVFDLSDVSERKVAIKLLNSFNNLVETHQGSITASGSEGRTKAIATSPSLGVRELELYHQIKTIFDPNNILNPDTKLGSTLPKVIRNLKTSNSSQILSE